MTALEERVASYLPSNVTEAQVRVVVSMVIFETLMDDEKRRLARLINECSGSADESGIPNHCQLLPAPECSPIAREA